MVLPRLLMNPGDPDELASSWIAEELAAKGLPLVGPKLPAPPPPSGPLLPGMPNYEGPGEWIGPPISGMPVGPIQTGGPNPRGAHGWTGEQVEAMRAATAKAPPAPPAPPAPLAARAAPAPAPRLSPALRAGRATAAPLPPELSGRLAGGAAYYPPDYKERVAAMVGEVQDPDAAANAAGMAALKAPGASPASVSAAMAAARQAAAAKGAAAQRQTSQALAGEKQWLGELEGTQASRARLAVEAGKTIEEVDKADLALLAREKAKLADLAAQRVEVERDQAAAAGERQRAMETARVDVAKRMQAADREVKEYRIRDRRPGAKRAVDMLAAALGALGAGLAKMPNFAMDAIQANMDRDIAAQKEELADKRGAAQQVRNDFQVYRQQFQDDAQAELAMRATQHNEIAAMAQQVAAKTQQARAKWQMIKIARMSGLKAEDAELMLQENALMNELARRQATSEAQAAALRRRALVPEQRPGMTRKPITDKEKSLYHPFANMYFGDSVQMKAYSKEISPLLLLRAQNNRVRALAQKEGVSLNLVDRQTGRTLHVITQNLTSQALLAGVITEADRPSMDAAIVNAASADELRSVILASTASIEALVADGLQTKAQAYGGVPGEPPTVGLSEKGEMQWIGQYYTEPEASEPESEPAPEETP